MTRTSTRFPRPLLVAAAIAAVAFFVRAYWFDGGLVAWIAVVSFTLTVIFGLISQGA